MATLFWALVVLGVLIFVHELGHFWVARLNGIKVEVFSLGFGPRVLSYQGRETEYVVCAIPLGGYVKMLGESEPEAGDAEAEVIAPQDLGRAFFKQKVGVRFAVVFAGPAFNFLFALLALTVVFMAGVEERLPVVGSVTAGEPAEKAGLKPGDRIVNIDGLRIERWESLSQTIKKSDGRPLLLTILRDDKQWQVEVIPSIREVPTIFGEITRMARIGIAPADETVMVRYGPLDSLVKGADQCWRMIDLTITSIWKLVTRVISTDQIGGPILIAELAGKTAAQGMTSLLFFMALISINLGILNLLPVPILDGGHLLFFAIEAVKGGPLNEKVQVVAQRIGMALLFSLMLLAVYNDVVRLLTPEQ